MFAALGSALATLLPAQTTASPSTNRFIPENSALVLRTAAPAKLREQFASTQLAKLGETQSLAPVMGMFEQQTEMVFEMMRSEGLFDADVAESLASKWKGDIVLSVQVDWDTIIDAIDYGELPEMSVVIAMSPGGDFDLADLSNEIDAFIDRQGPEGAIQDMIVGDLTMRRMETGDGVDIVLPTMIDNHLVMLIGTSIEKDAAKLISNEGRFANQTKAPLFVHAAIGKLISSMLEMDTGEAPFDMAELMDLVGIGALQHLSMSIQPDGTAVTGDMHIGMRKNNRGLFGMLPKGNQPPKLLSSIPPDSAAFAVTSMNFSAVMNTVRDAWGLIEDFTPMTFDDVMDMFTEATTVDFETDLLNNMGKEILTVQDIEGLMDLDFADVAANELAITSMFMGNVFGIALNDSATFEAALDKVIRSRGLHVGRKTESYANTKIHRMKLLGMLDLEYSVNNDLFLIALGGTEGTSRILRNIIDTRATGEAQMPNLLTQHINELPPGWNSVGITPITAILEGVAAGFEAASQLEPNNPLSEAFEGVQQIMRTITADMKRLGIDSLIQTSRCDDNGFTGSWRW